VAPVRIRDFSALGIAASVAGLARPLASRRRAVPFALLVALALPQAAHAKSPGSPQDVAVKTSGYAYVRDILGRSASTFEMARKPGYPGPRKPKKPKKPKGKYPCPHEYPGYPGYPGYPSKPKKPKAKYPGYPCPPFKGEKPPKPGKPPKPPKPGKPPKPPKGEKPKVRGLRSVSSAPDSRGRFLLRRVLVQCPASSHGSCRVLAYATPSRSRARRKRSIRLRRAAFGLRAGRSSRIRFRLARGSFGRLVRFGKATFRVQIIARDAAGASSARTVKLTLRARRSLSVPRAGRRERRRSPTDVQGLRSKPRPDIRRGEPVSGPRRSQIPLTIGIGDQNRGIFTHPLFTALPVERVRLVTPWNAVFSEPSALDEWLGSARAAKLEPVVAFEHARGDHCPDRPCRLPTVHAYAAAFDAFRARYPWVRLITPWNEPNHRSQPTASHPRRAADYYNVARIHCGDCELVAGDILDAPGMRRWLIEYKRGLSGTPRIWGLHNYYDTTYFRDTGVKTMLELVSGDVWLTETGGIVSLVTADRQVAHRNDELRAEASVRFLFDLARRYRERIGRIYIYQWQSPPGARFDAGLIAPDGRPRPAYDVVRRELVSSRNHRVRDAVSDPLPGRSRSVAQIPGMFPKLRITSDRHLRVSLACSTAGGQRCSGLIHVESARYRRARLVNGRPSRRVLEPRIRAFEAPRGDRARIAFAVPRGVLSRLPARGRLNLRMSISVTGVSGTGESIEYVTSVRVPRKVRSMTRRR
jgi:hypothetical protein